MGFVAVSLPCPAANGSGAAVDVSTFGALKTVTVVGNTQIPTLQPFVTIEVAIDSGHTKWAPLETFQGAGEATFEVACHWMRATVSNYRGGGSPTAEVGGEDSGTDLAQVAVPAGNGEGAATDVHTLPTFKTVQIGGAFRGAINILISEDGGSTYQTALSFSAPGIQSASFAADFMKVERNGVPQIDPGTPFCWVGATSDGGGGGGGIGVNVENQDIAIPNNPHSTLDFRGAGVTASDAGAGVARIQIDGTGDLGWYGTAIDGDLHFDGAANVTIRGVVIAPVANKYTVPDTVGDIFGDTVTVDTGVELDMAGFYLRCATELAGDGDVTNNGGAGGDGVPGAPPTGGAAGVGAPSGTLLGGQDGVAGGDASETFPGGANGNNAAWFPSRASGHGGNGGAAHGTGGQPGGTGGVSKPQQGFGTYMVGQIATGDGCAGGASGGSGTGLRATNSAGGGSGGGGGTLGVAAKTFANYTGTLRVKGGKGGDGKGVTAGGGGGAQGGVILIVTNDNAVPATDVSGGAGGAAAGVNGDPGLAGTAGVVIAISPVWGPL